MQTQTIKEKTEAVVDDIMSNTTDAARRLADEAQAVSGRASSQLADWGDRYGDKAAALWAVGGRRVRKTVLARPYWSLALVLGVSAVTIYLLTRRKRAQNNAQTSPRLSAQDRLQHGIESHRNRKAAYTS